MRWEALLADLAARGDALELEERAAEVSERTRIEFGRTTLRGRLVAALGAPIRVVAGTGVVCTGALVHLGSDWMLLVDEPGREHLVALRAVRTVAGLGRHLTQARAGSATERLGMGSALRALARDRSLVWITLVDATEVSGTVDAVGGDYLDIAVHATDDARRRQNVTERRLVPIQSLAVVRRDGP